ncbi:hypothetical protein DENSPDRAFT_869651 [Dentipellis sp. KUC8613]|nr:hypothetical protein DENSPDRAFT_869651 [Dentipellis sp. KUC8613]
MARATRSAKHQEEVTKDKPADAPALTPARAATKGSKKRKRTSVADPDEQPLAKQQRNDDAVKEEAGEHADLQEQTTADVKGAGDVPINSEDAQRILDILEMVDTQGLLDRVFPLPLDPAESLSVDPQSSQPQSYSFRTLLKESARHPLRVLKSAVQPLFPVFAHPRSRPSTPAAEQLKFCHLALSLLDQSSFHTLPAALSLECIIPEHPGAALTTPDETVKSSTPPPPSLSASSGPRKRRYALVQKLPTGDWWTSLNSDFPTTSVDGKDLRDLPTAHAELVAVLPSALDYQPGASSSSMPIPTLGSYTKKSSRKITMPSSRHVSCGTFLDYGPYASFAPTFDQDGVEVGRDALGEVLWMQEKKRRAANLVAAQYARREKAMAALEDVEMHEEVQDVTTEELAKRAAEKKKSDEQELEALLPPEEVACIKAALGSLEMEEAVQELLERNSKALQRLEELQLKRLGGEDGGKSRVKEGSEEWDIAQGIMESLTVLASLRPRSSSDSSPLTPSPSILHKLHLTLPAEPSPGWYGTLPPNRATALHDDSTISLKAGAALPAPAPVPAASSPAPAAPKPSAPAQQPQYQGYGSYPNYTTQYRGGYGYAPGTNNYYPNAYGQTPTTAGQTTPYGGQYSYPHWYGYQQPQAAGQPQGTAQTPGRGTPQPTPGAVANSYAGFFNNTTQPTQPQVPPTPQPQQVVRAVANTVAAPQAAGKPYAPTWASAGTAAATPQYTPTLPPHMRTQVPPATPTPTGGGGWQYYAGYQQTATQR